jgi:integrase
MQKVWFRKSVGCWYATFTTNDGQQQIKLLKGPSDRVHRKLAEQKLLSELASRPASSQVSRKAPDWLTVRGVFRGFLKHSRKTHEPATTSWYKTLLSSFCKRYGSLRVNQLGNKHVKRWIEKSRYNATSANRAIGAVKAAFNWAVEEEHIPANPIAHVRKPKSLVRDRVLLLEERQLILASIRGKAFRFFVRAMTLTGCRPGEIAKLRAADYDASRGLWVLNKHKTKKKTGKDRLIYLCPEAIELTKHLIAACPDDGPIFRNSRRQPWTGNAIRIRFRNLREKHPQLKGVIAYSYRASFATDALEAGIPDASVAALLGHTTTATLHKFYNRLSQKTGHLKDAAAKATQAPKADEPRPDTTA